MKTTELTDRLSENAPGPWFVTDECIICGLCDDLAPEIFRPLEDFTFNIVHHQPESPEQESLAQEAAESCPTLAIHRTET